MGSGLTLSLLANVVMGYLLGVLYFQPGATLATSHVLGLQVIGTIITAAHDLAASVVGSILALPWYMWLSLAGNVIGVFIFVQNPLAILGALAGSPFNTDVSGLRNAISSDTVQPGRWKAKVDGDIALFIVGAYVNSWWDIATWIFTLKAPLPMMKEMSADPSIGFLGCINLIGNPTIQIQYWQSKEHLSQYAAEQRSAHVPVWEKFNRTARDAYGNKGVGVFHETYILAAESIISGYRNCPPTGLGRFTGLEDLERSSPLHTQPGMEPNGHNELGHAH